MARPRPRSHAVAVLALVLTVVFAGEAAGAAAVPQRGSRARGQLLPSANAEFQIWAANSEGFPNRFQAYGRRRGTNGAFRLNAPGTRGYAGGIDQVRTGRSTSRSTAGPPISTRSTSRPAHARSCRPPSTRLVGSGVPVSNVLPVRARRGTTTTLFLYHRGPQTLEKLVSYDLTTFSAAPGRWESGTRRGPSVVPPTAGPSCETRGPIEPGGSCPRRVGAVRADRRRRRCPGLLRAVGAGVRRRGQDHAPAARGSRVDPRSIATSPPGIDVGFQLSVEVRPDRLDLWFSRYRCAPEQGDVFRLRGV